MPAGMQDYFGKKLGRWVGKHMANLSPIDLAQESGRRKLRSAGNAGFFRGADQLGKAVSQKNTELKGLGLKYTWGDYFTGKNIDDIIMPTRRRMVHGADGGIASVGGLDEKLRQKRMRYRIGVPAILGAGALLDTVIGPNPASDASRGAMTAGAVLGTGAALSRFGGTAGKWSGVGLFGYSALNVLRSGDQWGPF